MWSLAKVWLPQAPGKKRKAVPSEAESKNPHIMETIKQLRNCKYRIMKFSLVFFMKYFYYWKKIFLKINYFGKVIWSKNIKSHTSTPSFTPRHGFSSFTWNPTAGLQEWRRIQPERWPASVPLFMKRMPLDFAHPHPEGFLQRPKQSGRHGWGEGHWEIRSNAMGNVIKYQQKC